MPEPLQVNRSIVLSPNGEIPLLLRTQEANHNPSEWELPGGKVDPGETVIEGMWRELDQEIHHELQVRPWLQLMREPKLLYAYEIPDGRHQGRICEVFGSVLRTQVRLVEINPAEHAADKWFRYLYAAYHPRVTDMSTRVLQAYEELYEDYFERVA